MSEVASEAASLEAASLEAVLSEAAGSEAASEEAVEPQAVMPSARLAASRTDKTFFIVITLFFADVCTVFILPPHRRGPRGSSTGYDPV